MNHAIMICSLPLIARRESHCAGRTRRFSETLAALLCRREAQDGVDGTARSWDPDRP